MLQDLILAFRSFSLAHTFIQKNKLWRWILITGILYAILFCIGIYFFWIYSNQGIQYLFETTGITKWLESKNSSWLYFLIIVGQIIIVAGLMALYFSWFKYFFLIIGSPIFALLSEQTEAKLTGKTYPFSFVRLFTDAGRAISISLRNLLWQTVYLLAILVFSFIPVVGWISPIVALVVESYYFGFSMLDYNSERQGMPVGQSIDFIGQHKGLAIGNGLGFYLMHLIPILGWVLAPSYAVIAAAISMQKLNGKTIDL
jgi:CysZ protein